MLAIVRGHVHKAVVCASPKRSFFHLGFGEREDSIVIFNRSDVVGERSAARLLLALIVAGKIPADLRPALTVIGGFEDAFGRSVKRVRIMG